jgi:hypothetical protein
MRNGYQAHYITLRKPGLEFKSFTAKGLVPEIGFLNSYDGTRAQRLYTAIFRTVCLNGLVVGGMFESIRVVHTGDALTRVLEGIDMILAQFPLVVETVNRWSELQLNPEQQLMLAQQSAQLVLPESAINCDFTKLVQIAREGDRPNDLWTVFNRIQSILQRGGLTYRSINEKGEVKNNTAREVKSLKRSIGINQDLWDLTENFSKAI